MDHRWLRAVFAGAVVLACSTSPAPSSSPIATLQPGATGFTRPIPTPSPYQGQAVNGLVTYPGRLVTFEYPAGWRMITGDFSAYHYYTVEAALGTGDWTLDCVQSVQANGDLYSETCGGSILDAGPGEVVVEMSTHDSPAFSRPTPPPEAVVLESGLRYTTESSGSRTTWRIYGVSDGPPLDVIAEFGSQPSAAARAQVEALVASIRLTP